jgi:hypothetical protein
MAVLNSVNDNTCNVMGVPPSVRLQYRILPRVVVFNVADGCR